jgi:hypothetical protein
MLFGLNTCVMAARWNIMAARWSSVVSVAVRGSWLLLCVLQLMFLRLLEAFKLRVRLDYSSGGDLKAPATAANTRCSARSSLPLTGNGYGAVVRPHNYSSSLE